MCIPILEHPGGIVTEVLARGVMLCLRCRMSPTKSWPLTLMLPTVLITAAIAAAPRVHIISFGKWTSVEWLESGAGGKPMTMKVRAVLVDGRVKEFVLGSPHEVTDRLFVARRVLRVNDSLPDEPGPSRWQWQRGGWLVVDRVTGRISPINLPEFDAFHSAGTWYRDYIAYCGIADDGKKTYALVAQLSRRKPVLKKLLSNDGLPEEAAPDSACPAPTWQRSPVRVTFEPAGGAKQTFSIHGHVVDVIDDTEEDAEGSR
jgi:hypothetical protein